MRPEDKNTHRIVIRPDTIDRHYWRDAWRFRELLYMFTWRDLRVRYRHTMLGLGWTVLKPLVATLFFTFFYHRMGQLPEAGAHAYPLLVLAGFLPWQFFSMAVQESGGSLLQQAGLVSKIYFPRILVPASSVLTAFAEFLITLVLLLGLMAWYRAWPGWPFLLLPFFVGWLFLLTLGAGCLFSALQVRFRDLRFIIGFLLQFGIFVTPVGFSSTLVPGKWRALYSLNPMVGVIDGFRWCILGEAPEPVSMFISLAVTGLLFLLGIRYFRSREKNMADIL